MPDIGDRITWRGRTMAEPTTVERTGTIMTTIPPCKNPHDFMAADVPFARRRFSEAERYPRWLVHGDDGCWYAPRIEAEEAAP